VPLGKVASARAPDGAARSLSLVLERLIRLLVRGGARVELRITPPTRTLRARAPSHDLRGP
jgi:hypothetical protein